MERLGSRTGRLAALAGAAAALALLALAAWALLQPDAAGPRDEAPAVLRAPAPAAPDDVLPATPRAGPVPAPSPAGAAPEALPPALEPGWFEATVTDADLARTRFDDEILGRVFIVRLRDAQGRTPSGLQVRATVKHLTPGAAGKPGATGPSLELGRASPDPDGLWRWPIAEELGHAALRVELRFTWPSRAGIEIVQHAAADAVLDLRMPELATLHGRLEPGSLFPAHAATSLRAQWTWRERGGGTWTGSATTGVRDGAYAFERCVIGKTRLDLVVEHRLAQALPPPPRALVQGETLRWDLLLDSFPALVVEVLDGETREPVPGALVELSRDHEWFTGPDGCARFLATAIEPPGLVRVFHDDWESGHAVLPDDVAQREQRLTILLHRDLRLAGRLVDAEGRAVAGADVSAGLEGGWPSRGVTGDDGSFALEGVSPGPGQFLVFTLGGVGASRYALDVRPDDAPRTYTLHAASALRVTVRRADGSPLPDGTARVLALGEVPRDLTQGVDAAGRAAFEGLDVTGPVLVSAHGRQPSEGVASLRLDLQPGDTREVQFVLAPDDPWAASPTVHVVLDVHDRATSAPLAIRVKVEAFPAVTSDLHRDTLTFRLGPAERTVDLPRGLVRLDVEDPLRDFAVAMLTVDTSALPDGAVVKVPLRLQR